MTRDHFPRPPNDVVLPIFIFLWLYMTVHSRKITPNVDGRWRREKLENHEKYLWSSRLPDFIIFKMIMWNFWLNKDDLNDKTFAATLPDYEIWEHKSIFRHQLEKGLVAQIFAESRMRRTHSEELLFRLSGRRWFRFCSAAKTSDRRIGRKQTAAPIMLTRMVINAQQADSEPSYYAQSTVLKRVSGVA